MFTGIIEELGTVKDIGITGNKGLRDLFRVCLRRPAHHPYLRFFKTRKTAGISGNSRSHERSGTDRRGTRQEYL